MAAPEGKPSDYPSLSILNGEQCYVKPRLLYKVFEDVTAKNGTALATVFNTPDGIERKTTYKELNGKANRMANYLLDLFSVQKVQPNVDNDYVIMICMDNSDVLVAINLAIWKCGACYSPIDPLYPQVRVDHVLGEVKPIAIICDKKDMKDFSAIPIILTATELIELSAECNNKDIEDDKKLDEGRSEIICIYYTSGSTGMPKGVRIQSSILINRFKWQMDNYPFSETEKYGVFKTIMAFGDAVNEIWQLLLAGLTVLCVPKHIIVDPEKFIDILEKYKIERILIVASLLRTLLMILLHRQEETNKKWLRSMKHWVSSSEPLSVSIVKLFYQCFPENEQHCLYNFYGSTENGADVTYYECRTFEQVKGYDKVPVGQPVYNTSIYLLDQDFRPVKLGDTGEVYVVGRGVTMGYSNNRQPEKFLKNPYAHSSKYERMYRTGDFAAIKDGFLSFDGRKDTQVKVRGIRIDLSEIEHQLEGISVVDTCIVLCHHPGTSTQAIVAFAKLKPGIVGTTDVDIQTELEDRLSPAMMPKIIIVEDIPLMVNGKIDRQLLLKNYEKAEKTYDFSNVPGHLADVAKDLFDAISQTVGASMKQNASINDNFYDIGGDSLNSIHTISLLKKSGYSIGVTDFINAKDLMEIVQIISSKDAPNKCTANVGYTIEILRDDHKDDSIDVLAQSFYERGDLDQLLKPALKYTDYKEFLEPHYKHFVENKLCFVAVDKDKRVIGTSFNVDAHREINIESNNQIKYIVDYLGYLEKPILKKVSAGNRKILNTFMMGTRTSQTPQEGVNVMNFMADTLTELAKKHKFVGILTTDTSKMTQQWSKVTGYQTMVDHQSNTYVHADKSKPFQEAPDHQRAMVHYLHFD